MQALKALFDAADTVFCECGQNLTHERNLAELARKGCPKCGSKRFTYNVTDPKAVALLSQIQGLNHAH